MWFRLLPSLFVVVVTASPARSEPNDAKEQAGELAKRSAAHYRRGEFEQAASLLRQAYARYPEPNLLYNLARSLEGRGDRQGAIDAYERYLGSAKQVEDRARIERRIATLKAELAEEQERDSAQVAIRPEIVAAEKAPAPGRRDRGAWPWITIASGAGLVAAGGLMGYLARESDDRAEDAPSGVAAQESHDRARTQALTANILYGVGGAVIVTGVVFAW